MCVNISIAFAILYAAICDCHYGRRLHSFFANTDAADDGEFLGT